MAMAEAGHPLDARAMTVRQIVATGLCVALNALDGFDVLAISFASPGIAAEWHVDRAALGVVLSAELIGMAVGSVLLGAVADRSGRRPAILACLAVMTAGMASVPFVGGIGALLLVRLLTGLGIGGMLAGTNAMAAELANARRRALAVTVMAAGYPLGAVLGGALAAALLGHHGWRSVFVLGAGLSGLCVPLVLWLLPESIGFLLARGRGDVLARVNAVLAGLGQPRVQALPARPAEPRAAPIASLFRGGLARVTIALTLAYLSQLMTFYFILKWIPKIVVDMGFSPARAGGVLVWANVGGLVGGLSLGLLTQRFGLRRLMTVAFAASFAAVVLFGCGQANLGALSAMAAATGLCTNACMVGLYALVAEHYPSAVRGGGTGFVIGVGRGGAALGPIAAGAMFQAGEGLPVVAATMATGSLVALFAVLALPRRGPMSLPSSEPTASSGVLP